MLPTWQENEWIGKRQLCVSRIEYLSRKIDVGGFDFGNGEPRWGVLVDNRTQVAFATLQRHVLVLSQRFRFPKQEAIINHKRNV